MAQLTLTMLACDRLQNHRTDLISPTEILSLTCRKSITRTPSTPCSMCRTTSRGTGFSEPTIALQVGPILAPAWSSSSMA